MKQKNITPPPPPKKRSKINKSHPLQIEILFANLNNLGLYKTVTLGHTCSKYAFIHTVSDVLSTPQQVAQEDCQKEYPMETRIFFKVLQYIYMSSKLTNNSLKFTFLHFVHPKIKHFFSLNNYLQIIHIYQM